MNLVLFALDPAAELLFCDGERLAPRPKLVELLTFNGKTQLWEKYLIDFGCDVCGEPSDIICPALNPELRDFPGVPGQDNDHTYMISFDQVVAAWAHSSRKVILIDINSASRLRSTANRS